MFFNSTIKIKFKKIFYQFKNYHLLHPFGCNRWNFNVCEGAFFVNFSTLFKLFFVLSSTKLKMLTIIIIRQLFLSGKEKDRNRPASTRSRLKWYRFLYWYKAGYLRFCFTLCILESNASVYENTVKIL